MSDMKDSKNGGRQSIKYNYYRKKEHLKTILRRVNKERASKKPVLKFNGDNLVRDVSQKPKPEKKVLIKHQLKEEFSNQNLGAES